MLIILGGLPGVGKSTLAKKLAKKLNAVYLRIDSIEQAIKEAAQFNTQSKIHVIAEGYLVAYAMAKDNLDIGLTVITDSVNPIEKTRHDFRQVALETNKPYVEIEIICSDKITHQERIETRQSTVQGLKLPTWQDVLNRDYEGWKTKHLTIDTAMMTIDEALETIITTINKQN